MKLKKHLLSFLLIISSLLIANGQSQLTEGIQTSSLGASIAHITESISDINSDYYVIAYRTHSDSSFGAYLKIYDATTFAATSPQVYIPTFNFNGLYRVRIDNSNNIYVLYSDKESETSTNYVTYMSKYSYNGTQIGGRVKVLNNTKHSDIEVAPDGNILIGCTEFGQRRIKFYNPSMSYLGYKTISTFTEGSIQMDMKGDEFVIGFSIFSDRTTIKLYRYVSSFWMGVNNSIEIYSYTDNDDEIYHDNNSIALRTNGDVFYVAQESTYPFPRKVKKLASEVFLTVFQNSAGYVDVDINDKLIISKNYGSPELADYKVSLYDSDDSHLFDYILDDKINNHLSSLAIYDCDFLVTGIDRLYGGNPYSYTYESFHQLFSCQNCRPNSGATAVAKFRYPYQVNQVPSKYGPLDVTELCLEDNLLVDGSLSSCEEGYYVGLSEFDPLTWSETLVLHSGWVYPLVEAPNNINIVDFLPSGYHLKPGKIYKFRLAVGSPWHSVDIFFEVSCCHREIIEEEGDDQDWEENKRFKRSAKDSKEENVIKNLNGIKIFPNPVDNVLNIETSISKLISYQVIDVNGHVIFSKKIKENEVLKSINVNSLKQGVYMLVCLDENNNKITNKFIKK